MGSNTLHLLIVDAHYGAAPTPASKLSRPLRLAEHLTSDNRIDDSATEVLIDFVRASLRLAEDTGATEVMAFATSAVRDARNGEEVLRRVLQDTGLVVDVLSGEDEARMTFLAVRRWFGWSSGRLMVLDIGGGSLEVATGMDEEPDVAVSLPLGAGRVTRSHLVGDPPTEESVRELRRHARALIASATGRLLRFGQPSIATATSKTFRQLARVAGAAPSSDGVFVRRVLTYEALQDLVARLSSMPVAEVAGLPGVSQGRSGQLLAGAVVAESAMDLLGIDQLVVCPWALREGIILHRMDGMPQ